MAVDQAFGVRGSVSPIRFISFPVALTFPFEHSNWQKKNQLSLVPQIHVGNHFSSASHSTPLVPSSLKVQPHHDKEGKMSSSHGILLGSQYAWKRASLKRGVTFTNQLREGHTSAYHFLPIPATSLVSALPTPAPPAYLNNSSEVQPSLRILISIRKPIDRSHTCRECLSHPFHLDANFWVLHIRGQTSRFQKTLGTEEKLYKLSSGKGERVAEPQWLGEPRRPRVSLMMSLPSPTETQSDDYASDWAETLQSGFFFLYPSIPNTQPASPCYLSISSPFYSPYASVSCLLCQIP